MLGSSIVKHLKSFSSSFTSSSTSNQSKSKRRRPGYRSRFGIEHLEDRSMLASYTWNMAAETLIISLATDEDLTITVSGNEVSFALSSGDFTMNGGDMANGSGTPTITIAADELNTSIAINNDSAISASNNVTFSGASSIMTGTVDIDLTATGTNNTIEFTGGFDLETTTSIVMATTRNIRLGNGTHLSTEGEDGIKLSANQQTIAGQGNFVGIEINGATITTSMDGDIVLEGRGGNTGTGNHGIVLRNEAVIESTSTDSTAGSITLTGVGGNGNLGNYGVRLMTDAEIKSAIGNIAITGTGGDGVGNSDIGVILASGASISSTGSGANAASITVNGTGGSGGSQNFGVWVVSSEITSEDGNISLIGKGGGASGDKNMGVVLSGSAKVESTGTDQEAATISIKGTGGTGLNRNMGVRIASGADVTSKDGDIDIEGQGGTNTGTLNLGVLLGSDASVTSSGTTAGAAKITIKGTAGTGTSRNSGVWIGNSVEVTTAFGDIAITGNSKPATGALNMGVFLTTGATVSSTGTGSSAANIAITGTGGGTGNASNRNDGVRVRGNNSKIKSVDGDIRITGDSGVGKSADIRLIAAQNVDITGTGEETFVGTVVST